MVAVSPIETVVTEHVLIRRFLDILTLTASRLEVEELPPVELLERAVAFARTFNDEYHHVKEERVMFRMLAGLMPGELDEQLEELESEHALGRNLMSDVERLLPAYAAGDPRAVATLRARLETYTSLLRRHIHTEDYTVLPVARDAFTRAELAALAAEFDRERARVGEAAFADAERSLDAMGALLGPG